MRYFSSHKRLMGGGGSGGGGVDFNTPKGRSDGADSYHLAGQSQANLSSGSAGSEVLFGIPFYSPRAATVDSIAIYLTVPGTFDACGRWGVYSNVSAYNPFPNALLFDGGNQSFVVPAGILAKACPLALSGNSLYWLAYNAWLTDDAYAIKLVSRNYQFPCCGVDNTLDAPASLVCCDFPYGALPAVFPNVATVFGAEGPAIGLRYSS